MARTARLLVKEEDAIYHVISRTALDGFVLGDVEKDYLLDLTKWLSDIFFVEVFGFCIMGNHFHILVKMKTSESYSDKEVKNRLSLLFSKEDRVVTEGQLPYFREKLSNLSEFIKEIKQRFSRYYNKLHGRRGYFWGDRFKSVIVENGDTLINCLAYIDLNPIRAGLVTKPEDYRWCSIGYHVQTDNKKGALDTEKGASIDDGVIETERDKNYELTRVDRLRFKTRYFTDSGIISTKGFVVSYYEMFKGYFNTRNEKRPKKISGFDEIYSLKRLANKI